MGSGRSGRSGSNNRLVNSNYDVLYRRRQIIEAATGAAVATWQFPGPGRIAEVVLVNSTLGSAFTYNSLNQLTIYQRGDVTVSGNTGSIAGATLTQDMRWNPQGALTYNNVNNVTLLDNLGNAQNQNTSNTYNSNGDASSSTNAAGQGVNAVYNAWGKPVGYTISQSIQVGTDPTTGTPIYQTFTQTETIQYDAFGRPLGEYVNVTLPVSGGSPNTEATQHTFVYDANSGNVIQEINQIDGTDPVRYVYGPNPDSNSSSSDVGTGSNVIVKEAGTGGSVTFNQMLYSLQGADGSTVAITGGNGAVVERCVYDGLGNAQALQANGTAYAADANPGTSGTPGQQINEYFVGATFDANGNETAAGTQYNWTILYHGENFDAMPGVYGTPQGAFNPRQQSLLAPDLSVIQAGVSAYDPLAGETGFQAFLGRHYRGIALGASVVAGTAIAFATAGLATPWVAGALGVEATSLGVLGTAAVGAISGTAGGAASGFAYSAGMGESPLQIAESTGENDLFGGVTGGVFGAAGGWVGRLLSRATAPGLLVTQEGGLRAAAVVAHGALENPIAIRNSAVAVIEVDVPGVGTTYYAAGSNAYLSPAQRASLIAAGVPEDNIFSGAAFRLQMDTPQATNLANHAGQVLLRNVPVGSTVNRWGISWTADQRPIPCVNCAPSVESTGGFVEGW